MEAVAIDEDGRRQPKGDDFGEAIQFSAEFAGRAYRVPGPRTNTGVRYVKLLVGSGQREKAIALLEPSYQENPDIKTVFLLADAYYLSQSLALHSFRFRQPFPGPRPRGSPEGTPFPAGCRAVR